MKLEGIEYDVEYQRFRKTVPLIGGGDPVSAILGVAGAGASIFGASKQASTAKTAAQTQAQATQYAADQQRAMFEEMLGLQMPYIQAGQRALPYLEQMATTDVAASPLYQMQKAQTSIGAQRAFGARGMAGGPAAAGAEALLQQQLYGSEVEKSYQRQLDLTKIGQQQAGTAGQMGTSTGSSLAALIASGGAQQANLLNMLGLQQAGMWGNIGSSLMGLGQGWGQNQGMQSMLKQFQDQFNQPPSGAMSRYNPADSPYFQFLQQ